MTPKSKSERRRLAIQNPTRDLRFTVPATVHKEVTTLRAHTDMTNEELLTDMVRVYKKNPGQWITARKTATRKKA